MDAIEFRLLEKLTKIVIKKINTELCCPPVPETGSIETQYFQRVNLRVRIWFCNVLHDDVFCVVMRLWKGNTFSLKKHLWNSSHWYADEQSD